MVTEQYHRELSNIVTHALLHLHCHIAAQQRFVPVHQRNALLIKWLKPKTISKDYASVKKDIKALIMIGRKSGSNVEQKLWELNDIHLETRASLTDADLLYSLLNALFEYHGYNSQLLAPGEDLESNVICMYQSEIEDGFDENNFQIRPLAAFMKTDNPEKLVSQVGQISRTHTVELSSYDQGVAHYTISLLSQ